MNNQIIDYIHKNFFKNNFLIRNSYRAKIHDEFFKKYPQYSNRVEILYNILHPGTINQCKECKRPTEFKNIYEGYRILCREKCLRINHDTNKKRVSSIRKTLQEEHGVSNVMQLKTIKDKVSSTIENRYGQKWYVETDEFKQKIIQASYLRYGTAHPMQSSIHKEKLKQLFLNAGRKSPRKFWTNREKRKYELIAWCLSMDIEIRNINIFDKNIPMTDQHLSYAHTCGNSWLQNMTKNPLCDICHRGSKAENTFKEWANKLDIDIKFHDRQILKPNEIDILFPNNKIGVEINGLYYHCDEAKRTSVLKKTNECNNKGIQLISIWEHEWLAVEMQEKIKLHIKLRLENKVLDKQLSIKELSTEDELDFVSRYQIKQYEKSDICIGLIDNDKCEMLLGIKSIRNDFVVTNYCNKSIIKNGLLELRDYFIHHILTVGQSIFLNADRRFFDKKEFYDFNFIKDSSPHYIWWKYKDFIKGKLTVKDLKNILKNDYVSELTERENMNANGWKRLTDAGNLKFVYLKK